MSDRRVRKTKQQLSKAMLELLNSRPYDDISVQEILDVADVGRATFYAHYSGKDSLVLDMFDDLLDHLLSKFEFSQTRILPVSEIFQHIGEVKPLFYSLTTVGLIGVCLDRLTLKIEQTLKTRYPQVNRAMRGVSLTFLVRVVVSTFGQTLKWWLEDDPSLNPQELDTLFHTMTLPMANINGLLSAFESRRAN